MTRGKGVNENGVKAAREVLRARGSILVFRLAGCLWFGYGDVFSEK